jgi:hypothetical protein
VPVLIEAGDASLAVRFPGQVDVAFRSQDDRPHPADPPARPFAAEPPHELPTEVEFR